MEVHRIQPDAIRTDVSGTPLSCEKQALYVGPVDILYENDLNGRYLLII